MELKQIARAFNMTIEQLAKIMGYTRQSLYYPNGKQKHRVEAAICNLHNLAVLMFQHEQEEAKRRFEAREKAVQELEWYLKGGSSNG